MNSELFGRLPPTGLFFRCAVPAVITSVFGALYSVIDGIFVGRYLGQDALAAVNLIMPVIMIVEAVSNMIATGASVNISMLLGQKRQEEASGVFSFSVKFIFAFSCIISAMGFFFARQFIVLIAPGAAEEAIRLSVEYLRVYSVFGPLIPICFALDNYLRVCGRERLSMAIGITTQALNVVLDFILIAVLHKGVREAAAASCISIVLGSVWMLALFMGKRMDIYYTKKNIPISLFLRIAVNGASEFFSTISMSVMSVIMNLFLLKYGGTTAVAAFSIVMYVDSIVGMLNFGICDSLQPAISYCYGAGLMSRMEAIFKRVLMASVITSVFAFLFMLLAGPSLATVFVKPGDEELLAMSITAIKIFSFSYLVGWVDSSFSSFFTALDRPARSMVAAAFGTLVFPIASLFLLTSTLGLNGIWLTAPVSALASSVLALVLAKTMKLDDLHNGEAEELPV